MYTWHDDTTRTLAKRGRETFSLLAAGAVFAIAALSATTQSLRITFAEPPSVLAAGSAWQAALEVKREGRPVTDVEPQVVLTDPLGIRHTFLAQPDTKSGHYRVKIQLPEGGRWTYEVRVGEKIYGRGEVRLKPALSPTA